MRAGIYGRNSAGEAKSIEDQLELGRRAVAEQGWTLAGTYSDDSSASRYRTRERTDWARLLADLGSGALDVLVLWKSARASRDETDWFPLLRLCLDRGVLIHVLADRRTYDPRLSRDWKTLGEDGVAAVYYSAELSENVRRGVSMAAAGGLPHGRAAFGYDRTYDLETKKPGRVPNGHAPIVREVFERLSKLTPISTLERDFQDRDLPSPSGKPWKRNTIRTIATNVSYIGKRLHDGELYDAQWTPLVDDATFYQVQEILAQPERTTTKPGSVKYLLSYLATSPCGGHVSRKTPRGEDRYVCTLDGCVSIVRDEADEVVERVILARLALPDARDLLVVSDTDRTTAARGDAARYRLQLEEARRSFEAPDGISAAALARKERALLPLIEEADRNARPAGVAGVVDEVLSADVPAAAWARLEMAARREVLSALAEVRIGLPTQRLPRLSPRDVRLSEALSRISIDWK